MSHEHVPLVGVMVVGVRRGGRLLEFFLTRAYRYNDDNNGCCLSCYI